VRDAQGNVMSVYEHKVDNTAQTLTYTQQEKHIYGSSRVGMDVAEKNMISTSVTAQSFYRESGKTQYELSNHLGNVLTVITDKKQAVESTTTTGTVDYFVVEILSASDYSPFGVLLQNREFTSAKYSYGWGSHEKVDEISGAGNHYTAEFWEYDPRTGRRWNIDPVYKHHLSNYSVMSGNPISRIDPNGANDGWIEDKKTGELTWDEKVNSQEDFEKSGYDKDKFSYAGQELQRAWSLGSTAGLYTQYYGPDGNTAIYDYPMWVEQGRQHIGLTEGGNPTIQAMIDNMNAAFPRSDGKTPISSDAEPWCGVFVYDCLVNTGQPVTSNSWQTPALNTFYSKNWNEGTVLKTPTYGAIAVMSYGHVAMVVGYDDTYVWILGGNQPANGAVVRDGTEVNITRYKRSLVSSYIIPTGYNAPPLGTFK
jgi:uncharacterized protein (TIGR02594 family)